MKITRYLLASSAAVVALLIASPVALAHSGVSLDASVRGDINHGFHHGSLVRGAGDHDAHGEDHRKHRDKHVKKHLTHEAFLSAIGATGAGTVTAISGSTFTLKSRGQTGTTTVTTNASTTYKVNGSATTSSALSIGSRAIVFGSADSSVGITASLVSILNVGFGWFKHIFH